VQEKRHTSPEEALYNVNIVILIIVITVVGVARVVCGAGSTKRYGVRPSVCPSVCLSVPARAHSSKPAAAGLLLWAQLLHFYSAIYRAMLQRRTNVANANVNFNDYVVTSKTMSNDKICEVETVAKLYEYDKQTQQYEKK